MRMPAANAAATLATAVGRALTSVALATVAGCDAPASDVGDARVGRAIIAEQACGACHRIPGVSQADGKAAPPLDHFASQPTIAGVLPNKPAELVRFLQEPESVVKGGAMPNMALTETQARQIAAYLYTLK
jgi:mono/diheme cytochrome c family protein